jgi:hypothetical protein
MHSLKLVVQPRSQTIFVAFRGWLIMVGVYTKVAVVTCFLQHNRHAIPNAK